MEKRDVVIAFRVSGDERLLIADMAQRLQRKQSDALRLVVTEAATAILKAANEQGVHYYEPPRCGSWRAKPRGGAKTTRAARKKDRRGGRGFRGPAPIGGCGVNPWDRGRQPHFSPFWYIVKR